MKSKLLTLVICVLLLWLDWSFVIAPALGAPASKAAGHRSTPSNPAVLGGRPPGCPPLWCACWLRHRYGRTEKRLDVAREWLKEGWPAAAGCVGCIVVLRRGHGGHVGIVQGYAGANPILLSGNHNHAVGVGEYSARRVLGYRYL